MFKRVTLASISAAAVILSGCGGGGSDKGVSFDAQVNYKTSGTYDVSKYLAPSANAINVYQEDLYTNKDGKKSFKGDPERSTYTEKYDVNGTKIVVKNGRDEVDTVYEIKADRITEVDDESTLEIARFAEPGDYLIVKTKETKEDNIPVTVRLACKVSGHMDNKKVGDSDYSDVLKVTCEEKSTGSNDAQSFSLSYQHDSSDTTYFAKGIGMIYSESEGCEDIATTINGNTTHNATCTKEIDSLISHNSL